MKAQMRVWWLVVAGAVLSLASAVTTTASAQQDAAADRATAFRAVTGPEVEQVPGGPLMVSAYAVVLVLLVGYVGRLALLQKKTTAEVERLTQAIERTRKAK
jgi:cytochrome c oxidase assembly factor CtaG